MYDLYSSWGSLQIQERSRPNEPASESGPTLVTYADDGELASETAAREAADSALQAEFDAEAHARLVLLQQGAVDRQWDGVREIGTGSALAEYTDSTEHIEDWADLNDVLEAANAQVSNNRFYAINATAPGGWNKAESLPLNGRWRISTLLYFKANGGGSTYFGINCGTSGKTLAANDPDTIVIGISAANARQISVGSNLSSINVAGAGILGTNPSTSDKTYLLTIEADDEDISFTLKGIGTVNDIVVWSFEKAALTALGKTINNVTCYLTDSRGSSGNGFGPWILQRSTIQPPRTKTVSSQQIIGQDFTIRRTSVPTIAPNNAWMYALPKNYDARKPSPLVIWCHQSVTGAAWDMWEETRVQPVTAALQDAGYIIAGANDVEAPANAYGNQESLDEFLGLYRMIVALYNVGPLFFYGASMGGLTMANAIMRREFPTPAAAACVGGAWDVGHVWDLGTPFDTQVQNAYGASDRATVITNSTGYDPIRGATADFRGVPWRLYTSAGDTLQPPANQQAFLDIVSPEAPEAELITASGAHLDASQYQASDVLAFFRRYGGL
jgi:hypothetical protein